MRDAACVNEWPLLMNMYAFYRFYLKTGLFLTFSTNFIPDIFPAKRWREKGSLKVLCLFACEEGLVKKKINLLKIFQVFVQKSLSIFSFFAFSSTLETPRALRLPPFDRKLNSAFFDDNFARFGTLLPPMFSLSPFSFPLFCLLLQSFGLFQHFRLAVFPTHSLDTLWRKDFYNLPPQSVPRNG